MGADGRGGGLRRWRIVRANSAAIPSSVRRFNQRRRANRIRSARPWAAVAAVALVVGVGFYLVYGTSVFGVSHVKVVGSGFVGDRAVVDAAAVRTGTPLARVNLDAVAHRVEKITGVSSAKVHRDWPNTLVIDVTPRKAIAAVPVAAEYVEVDASGVPFRTVASPGDLPIVEVAHPAPDDDATVAALAVLQSLPTAIRDQLVKVTASGPADVTLVLRGSRTIIWGDASDSAAKSRVALSLLQRPGKVIDVSAPGVVTVK